MTSSSSSSYIRSSGLGLRRRDGTEERRRRRCCLTHSTLFLIVVVTLALTARQIFDMLARLWLPVMFDFAQIVSTCVLFFGVRQRRRRLIIFYLIWTCIVWTSWNVFLICFYANIGGFEREEDTDLLHFRSDLVRTLKSWWARNVPGCQRSYDPSTGLIRISDCFLDYHLVEIFIASVHLILAAVLCTFSTKLAVLFTSTNEKAAKTSQHFFNGHSGDHRTDQSVFPDTSCDSILRSTVETCFENSTSNFVAEKQSGHFNASYYESSPVDRFNPVVKNTEQIFDRYQARQSMMVQNYRRNASGKNRRNSLPSNARGSSKRAKIVREKAAAATAAATAAAAVVQNPKRAFSTEKLYFSSSSKTDVDNVERKICVEKLGGQTVTVELSSPVGRKFGGSQSRLASLNCYSTKENVDDFYSPGGTSTFRKNSASSVVSRSRGLDLSTTAVVCTPELGDEFRSVQLTGIFDHIQPSRSSHNDVTLSQTQPYCRRDLKANQQPFSTCDAGSPAPKLFSFDPKSSTPIHRSSTHQLPSVVSSEATPPTTTTTTPDKLDPRRICSVQELLKATNQRTCMNDKNVDVELMGENRTTSRNSQSNLLTFGNDSRSQPNLDDLKHQQKKQLYFDRPSSTVNSYQNQISYSKHANDDHLPSNDDYSAATATTTTTSTSTDLSQQSRSFDITTISTSPCCSTVNVQHDFCNNRFTNLDKNVVVFDDRQRFFHNLSNLNTSTPKRNENAVH